MKHPPSYFRGRREGLMPSDFFKGVVGTNIIDELFNTNFLAKTSPTIRTDIQETDQAYILEAEMPGFNKENIEVEWQDGILTLSAKQKEEVTEEDQERNYVRKERYYGEISRSFRIDGIDDANIKAGYKEGILRVTLPKAATVEKKKTVDIE